MITIVIKQSSMYFNYAADKYYEPYDHTLIPCDCGRLCERGIGLCDPCITSMAEVMSADLDKIIQEIDLERRDDVQDGSER